MKKFLYVVIGLLSAQTSAFSQLNGTYTIGGATPSYATFTAAISALVTNGVSGPVTFNVRNGTYTEQLSINAVAGVSAVNKVVFQSENLDSTLVTLTFSSASGTDPHTLKFNGAQYITFRKMTIAGMGAIYRRIISFTSGSYNTVENCIVNAPVTSCTLGDDYQTSFWANNLFGTAHYITIKNNIVNNNCCGVMNWYNNYWNIVNNQFNNSDFAALIPGHSDYLTVSGNEIYGADDFGMFFQDCNLGLVITGNKVLQTGTNIGIYLENTQATVGAPALISNNFVRAANCIDVYYGNYINIYNNSAQGGNSCYRVAGAINNVRLVNNTSAASNCPTCYAFNIETPAAIIQSDNNNLYAAPPSGYLGRWNTTPVSTLAAWQSLTSFDANSVSINPDYVNPINDLHVCNPALDGQGLPLAAVANDIDGEPRNATTPDIGADEFDTLICGCAVPPTPGTIGGASTICSGSSNTYSIAAVAGATSYTWTLPGGWSGTSTTNSINTTSGTTSGNITVIANNACGSSASQTLNVTVNSLPTVTVTLNAVAICVDNASFALSGGSPAGGTYTGTGTSGGNFNAATAGVGTHTITYSFTDGNGCMNTSTDQITVNNCTGISNNEISNIEIYPNPFTNEITISGNFNGSTQLTIVNPLGEIVFSAPLASNLKLQTSNFSPGMYFVQIKNENTSVIKKIVKE